MAPSLHCVFAVSVRQLLPTRATTMPSTRVPYIMSHFTQLALPWPVIIYTHMKRWVGWFSSCRCTDTACPPWQVARTDLTPLNTNDVLTSEVEATVGDLKSGRHSGAFHLRLNKAEDEMSRELFIHSMQSLFKWILILDYSMGLNV